MLCLRGQRWWEGRRSTSAKPELLPLTMGNGAQPGERQRSFPRSSDVSSGNDMCSAEVAYCTVAEILS